MYDTSKREVLLYLWAASVESVEQGVRSLKSETLTVHQYLLFLTVDSKSFKPMVLKGAEMIG